LIQFTEQAQPSLLERYFDRQFYKNKKQEKQQKRHFFLYFWLLKMELPKKYIFQIWSTDSRLSLASSLKTARG
jgi:hypothetical protein